MDYCGECCTRTIRYSVILTLIIMLIWCIVHQADDILTIIILMLSISALIILPNRIRIYDRPYRIRDFIREPNVININLPENREVILAQIKEHIILANPQEIIGSEECVICLDDYDYDNNVGKLICNHNYHTKCIEKWLVNKPICPLCNYNILTDNEITLDISVR